MIGDVLVITDKHREAAKDIAKNVLPIPKDKYIISISGESGTGKSELGHLVRKELQANGILSKILHTDNYYITNPAERTEWRKKNGVSKCVGLNEYDWATIQKHLDGFRNGEKVTIPFLDIVTNQRDELTTDFAPIPVLILEGLYAINADTDYRVLIDHTYHETKDSRILRGKEPQNIFRTQVLEQEHIAVQSLRDTANLFVKTR